MLRIPFDPSISARQSFSVSLGGSLALVELSWNTFSSRWEISVTSNGSQVSGVRVVPGIPLFRQYRSRGLFDGDIVVLGNGNVEQGSPVGYEQLGNDYGLYYATADEVSAWERNNGVG